MNHAEASSENEQLRNVVWLWDLDRPDALMHLRIFVKALKPFASLATHAGNRSEGRYVLLPSPPDAALYPVADIVALATEMAARLNPAKFTSGVLVHVIGSNESADVFEPIVEQWRDSSELGILVLRDPSFG